MFSRIAIPLACIVIGLALLIAYAIRRRAPGLKPTTGKLIVDEILRDLGSVLVGAALVASIVHWQLEKAFLEEIDKKVMSAALYSLLGEPVGKQIDNYVLRQPFFYRDFKAEGLFFHDKTEGCLIGQVTSKWIVENRTPKSQRFPIYSFYSEIAQECCGTWDKEISIKTVQGDSIRTIPREEIEGKAIKEGNTYKFEELFELKPGQEICVKFISEGCLATEDRFVQRLRYPTEGMSVVFTLPEDIEANGRFYHPARKIPEECFKDPMGSNPYHISINGGVLPFQALEVFWKPKQRR